MQVIEIKAERLKTIDWLGDDIIDWASFKLYSLNGKVKELNNSYFAFKFDCAILSENGEYAFIYQKFGTKGLILKNGEFLREINRSYYFADAYEYPAVFVTFEEVTYLVHCPVAYNQLDFENVESGEIITTIPDREPADIFHSRLIVSPNQSYLVSKGWIWHPLDIVEIYNVSDCIENPKLLDADTSQFNYVGTEIGTANFIDDDFLIVGSSSEILNDDITSLPPNHIAFLNLKTKAILQAIAPKVEFGNLFAINKNLAWDMYQFPKIIDLNTGDIVAKDENIDSGKQRSAICTYGANSPQIAFNYQTKSIAIMGDEKIYVLIP